MSVFDTLIINEKIELMRALLIESGTTNVYFSETYFKFEDENIEILKFKILPFISNVEFTISLNGKDVILNNHEVTLEIVTVAYLNLRKAIHDFKN